MKEAANQRNKSIHFFTKIFVKKYFLLCLGLIL